eukprot:snap_masked-scaffold_37-processed-gene-1.16-mRNA-1 protein AED:1.00 eAED:1.00 QI:0/0/0/0/1/1/2/0/155
MRIKYEEKEPSLILADKIININYLRKYNLKTKIYILNITTADFEENLLNMKEEYEKIFNFEKKLIKIYKPKQRQNWRGKETVERIFGKFEHKFLMLKGSSMYHKWYEKPVQKKLQQYFKYSNKIYSFGDEAFSIIKNISKLNQKRKIDILNQKDL